MTPERNYNCGSKLLNKVNAGSHKTLTETPMSKQESPKMVLPSVNIETVCGKMDSQSNNLSGPVCDEELPQTGNSHKSKNATINVSARAKIDRRRRCKQCAECRKEDCGDCKYCM